VLDPRGQLLRAAVGFATLALVGIMLGECVSVKRTTIAEIGEVAGAWEGWLLTSRDFVPAILEIYPDGTFDLTARRVRAAGRMQLTEGVLRFESVTGWHGTSSLYENGAQRLLHVDLDDRRFTGRFSRRRSSP
jgi:hypothetical protein